jgi:hypothetical protein
MSHHLSEQDILRYSSRELLPAEILALHDHLDNCAVCQTEVRRHEQFEETAAQVVASFQRQEELEQTHLLYEEMADYVDNNADEVSREIADGHLEYCQSCKAEVANLLATKAQLALFPDATYRPHDIPSLRQRLVRLWQVPRVRIPIQVGAMLVLVGLIVWLLVFYSRKQSEEARKQIRTPDNLAANPSPNPSPSASPTDQTNANVVVDLVDGDGRVRLNSDGKLFGLESASAQTQGDVATALKNGRVRSPSFLSALRGESGRLMGPGSADYGLLNPISIIVESQAPTFRWRPLVGADNYMVTIYQDSKKVVMSDSLTVTQWKVITPLERGAIYTWQVRANRKGAEVVMPPPAAAAAKFKVLEASKLEEIRTARQSQRRSHLRLGILYAEAGMLDEAEKELKKLLIANPKSPVVQSLLRSVNSLRR